MQMKCQEAEDLIEAYGVSAEAYGLAVDALVEVLSGSAAEFWSALKIAESAMTPLKRLISISPNTSASETDGPRGSAVLF